MKRGMLHAVVGMLIVLIGAGPACACVAGGVMTQQTIATPPATVSPKASDGAAMPGMGQSDHSCCVASDAPVKPAAEPHDASCPQCQVMTGNVKTVQDHQALASWSSLHLVAIVPAMLGIPAVGALHVAVMSPVWSPPLKLGDLFHTFCLLTL